jgi:DNA repair exonuclease SbcCD ATPase subunit
MSTRIKDLTLTNFGKYGQISVSFDDNITYLVGPNGSAKSTMGLTGLWFIFEGIAQTGKSAYIGERFRFIGDAAASAIGNMTLVDDAIGEIKVQRKLTKTGTTLSFEGPVGVVLDQAWLSSLFNVLLIAPKKFLQLSGKEQALALGIDVSTFEKELAELKTDYTLINRELTNIGKIDEVTEVVKVEIADLIEEKKEAARLNLLETEKETLLATATKTIEDTELLLKTAQETIKTLQDAIVGYTDNLIQWREYKGKLIEPKFISVEDIDSRIETASTTNEDAAKYTEFLKKTELKTSKTKELTDNKEKQADVAVRQLAYIKSKELPFPDLTLGEDGGLLLTGRPLKEPHFSTGELVQIVPILLSALNPELRYVFIQDFNLLDEARQKQVEESLTSRGFQLVIEMVGTKAVPGKNCILMNEINNQNQV